ncbi:oxidoreductase C-terminal domain-containing protein [Streptomyces hirsutus]|uniref:oxidoreductase C-terminal domain-containing protein n=1 Tax=Streptomyces hirsutus TaxID=35620 RepID=UPI003403A055
MAAYAITGRREEYAGIPWFWSNQGTIKLQIAGLSTGHDRTLVRADPERGKHSVLYYRGDRILAADCVNSPLDFMAVRGALSKGQSIPYEAAGDPSVQLKSVTVDPAALVAAD